MEILNAIGSIASIVALVVSLYVARKVNQIGNSVSVSGEKNITAGRDAKVTR